jgi:hypothetical protein
MENLTRSFPETREKKMYVLALLHGLSLSTKLERMRAAIMRDGHEAIYVFLSRCFASGPSSRSQAHAQWLEAGTYTTGVIPLF